MCVIGAEPEKARAADSDARKAKAEDKKAAAHSATHLWLVASRGFDSPAVLHMIRPAQPELGS